MSIQTWVTKVVNRSQWIIQRIWNSSTTISYSKSIGYLQHWPYSVFQDLHEQDQNSHLQTYVHKWIFLLYQMMEKGSQMKHQRKNQIQNIPKQTQTTYVPVPLKFVKSPP